MQSRLIQKNWIKIRIANSEINRKSKTKLRVIRDLLLDFIPYFVGAYMKNFPLHVTLAQGALHYTSFEVSKWKPYLKVIYKSNHKQKMLTFKITTVSWKMIELTPYVNILWLHFVIYTKSMELFEFSLKENTIIFAY